MVNPAFGNIRFGYRRRHWTLSGYSPDPITPEVEREKHKVKLQRIAKADHVLVRRSSNRVISRFNDTVNLSAW
jgi:hypothetical protein